MSWGGGGGPGFRILVGQRDVGCAPQPGLSSNSKHRFTTSLLHLGGRCRKAMLGVRVNRLTTPDLLAGGAAVCGV